MLSDLYEQLAKLVEELCSAYDDIGHLRAEELLRKKEVWSADPEASIQARDRTASYAAATITAELHKAEARLHALNVRRSYLERLIDAAQTRN